MKTRSRAKIIGILLSIALILSLAACAETEGNPAGNEGNTGDAVDNATPPEGDADPTEDSTDPTDDENEDGNTEDGANNENGNGESENPDTVNPDGNGDGEEPDNNTEPDAPTAGDTNPGSENSEDTQDYYPVGTYRIDENGNKIYLVDGKEASEADYLATKAIDLRYYYREFSYTDETGEKSIEEIAEILYTMLFESAMEENDDLAFIIIESEIGTPRIFDQEAIALDEEKRIEEDRYGWLSVFPEISENCWGSDNGITIYKYAGYTLFYPMCSLNDVEKSYEYIGMGSGYRYITRDPATNTYTLSEPLDTPW